jgi:hypothetical protein
VKDAITKLGEKILEIIQRIRDFIKGIPNMFKESKWDRADVEKRADMVRKADPKRYEELKVYIDKGLLDFNTFSSMKDYYKNIDDLLDELKKNDVDENSLKGKLEKIKSWTDKNSDRIKTASVIIGIAGTGVVIALNWKKFRNESDKNLENESARQGDAALKYAKKFEEMYHIIENNGNNSGKKPDVNPNSHTKAYVLAQLEAAYEHNTKVNVSKITKLRLHLWGAFDKAIGVVKKGTVDLTDMGKKIGDEADRGYGVYNHQKGIFESQIRTDLKKIQKPDQ